MDFYSKITSSTVTNSYPCFSKASMIPRDVYKRQEFHYPPGEAIKKMKSCSTLLSEKQLLRHLASGFGCAAFTLLFGGKYLDCFFSLFIGIALQSFLYHARIRQSSRFFYTIAASALVTALSILPYALHAPVMVCLLYTSRCV